MALPKELEGKNPDEIAAYYESLLTTQKDTYETALASFDSKPADKKGDPPPEKKTTMNDLLTKPDETVKEMIKAQGVSREEWNTATAQMRDSMIYLAKERAMKDIQAEVAKNNGTFQWTRLEDQINKVVNAFEPMARTGVETWKSVYYYVVGQNQTTLEKEAVTKATLPAEPVMPGGNDPPEPIKLTKEQKTVAEGFGLTEDSFRKGITNMKDTKLPITLDNRQRR